MLNPDHNETNRPGEPKGPDQTTGQVPQSASPLPSQHSQASSLNPDSFDPLDESQSAENEPRERWSRRRFLGGLLAGTGALLAACGRGNDPTPTPTSTPASVAVRGTRSPIATPTAQQYERYLPNVSAGSPLSTPEPTLTPTPPKATPTDTPIPPTPTPAATPFPPGPPSKLGVHVERNDPQLFDLLETGGVAVVKTLELDVNFAAQIKLVSPRTKLIGRIHLPQASLSSFDPIATARTVADQLLIYAGDPARQPYFDGWEAFNEPVAANAEEMARLADFEAERTRLLAERGIRSVIGNFGTGQPPLDLWQSFLPAVEAAKEHDGWLGLHEYSAPTIYHLSTRDGRGRYPGVAPTDTGWLTLRYRQVYDQILKPAGLDIPLVMTELGVDGLVAERPGPASARGWQQFQQYWAENGYGLWGPGAYVEQLVWYDRAMQQDPYVIGGCIYGLGTSNEWITYDIGNTPVIAVLAQYLSVHAPTS